MPVSLRDALAETMTDWRDDLGPEWREALRGVEPALDQVAPGLNLEPWEPIFPARKRDPSADPERAAQRRERILGVAHTTHIFHAFDGLPPSRVKAVILGQDPYPHITRATGRCFEAGDLSDWHENPRMVASSLRRIVQALAYAKTGNAAYLAGDAAWPALARDIAVGRVRIQKPKAMFDSWQKRGVLLLNAGLTLTRYRRGGHAHQLDGHLPYWMPVIKAVLAHLVRRQDRSVVFLLWGGSAKRLFRTAEVERLAREAGSWETRVRKVEHRHPSAPIGEPPHFLIPPNPFLETNNALREMGTRKIGW